MTVIFITKTGAGFWTSPNNIPTGAGAVQCDVIAGGGGGGGGGSITTGTNGGSGGAGTEWGPAGSGGGGGGEGGGSATLTNSGASVSGGLYGGGGPGGAVSNTSWDNGGPGAQGIIVVMYTTPDVLQGSTFMMVM